MSKNFWHDIESGIDIPEIIIRCGQFNRHRCEIVLRSMAIGGLLATATALVGALLLLPAVLAWLGPRVNLGAIGRAPERSGPRTRTRTRSKRASRVRLTA